MNLSADNERLLEVEKKEELEWFEKEFDMLFKAKNGKFSKIDKKMANQILDNLTENINLLKNDQLRQILADVLESIEKKYPNLF